MNLVSWNYRGLGNPNKAEAIKDLMKMEPIDILILQETKIEGEILLNTSNTKWKFDSGKVVSARGSASEIGTFWSKNSFILGRFYESQHWIYTELRNTARGDLNIILDPKEKQGRSSSKDPFLSTVENLIQLWDLVAFKPVKGGYTWTNNRIGEHHILARLDKFLTSSSIMMDNRIVFSKILPKLTSNHKPILLCIKEEEDLGPLPFRFNPL
eukprot:PITA_21422